MKYKYKKGDKVRLCAGEGASALLQKNDGRVVTIKGRCQYTCAYYLKELRCLWAEDCFEEVKECI